jgi:hypothetical protein
MFKFFYTKSISHSLYLPFGAKEDADFILNRLDFGKKYGGLVHIGIQFSGMKVTFIPKNSILTNSKLYTPRYSTLMDELLAEVQYIVQGNNG